MLYALSFTECRQFMSEKEELLIEQGNCAEEKRDEGLRRYIDKESGICVVVGKQHELL